MTIFRDSHRRTISIAEELRMAEALCTTKMVKHGKLYPWPEGHGVLAKLKPDLPFTHTAVRNAMQLIKKRMAYERTGYNIVFEQITDGELITATRNQYGVRAHGGFIVGTNGHIYRRSLSKVHRLSIHHDTGVKREIEIYEDAEAYGAQIANEAAELTQALKVISRAMFRRYLIE